MCAAFQTSQVKATFSDLSGKVAILTGAGRGIGGATAVLLAQQGMKLVLAAKYEENREAILAAIRQAGTQCEWLTGDVSAPEVAKQIFDLALARFGGVDVLVNCAADKASVSFLKLDEAWYHRSFEGNVRIVYELSRLVALHMVETGRRGSIVHVSSVGGLRPHYGTVGYDISKAAIDHLARAMAIELGPHGIRVNAVAPGFTPTAEQRAKHPERTAEVVARIPLRRPCTGEDVAGLIAFLASDVSSYITGQVIYVDGGTTVQLSPPKEGV